MAYFDKLLSSVVQVFCIPEDLENGPGGCQALLCFLMVDCGSVVAVWVVHILGQGAHSRRNSVLQMNIYLYCTKNFFNLNIYYKKLEIKNTTH